MSDALSPKSEYMVTSLDSQSVAEHLLRVRRARNRIFSDSLSVVGEPAWDILLELFVSRRISPSLRIGELSVRLSLAPLLLDRYLGWLEKIGLVRLHETAESVALTTTAIERIEDAIGASPLTLPRGLHSNL
jgi:hypothetical protein